MPKDQEAPTNGFQPSAKLGEKLKKFDDRRIDLSCIKFPNDSREFTGASATVSRAVLVYPSGGQDRTDQFNPTNNKGPALQSPSGDLSRQQKDIAVKKMKMSDDPERVLGLTLREAEFLVGLSHENVIKLEGLVEDLSKDVVWLVFPWEENGTLKDFIASVDWEIPERIWLINDVAGGVEYLHSRQPPIRHGDLKSINILVNSQCRAVITDFGSARRLATEELDKQTGQDGNKPQATVSLEAALCGSTNNITITLSGDHYTIRWAAPELLRGDEASIHSDIWALGWVAYEVMTNAIPFQDIPANFIVITRVIRGMLPSITNDARMSLIRVLCSLMIACWSMDPQRRPSAEECQKSIIWMPMIRPNPIRTADAAASRARSPALLLKLGVMYRRQGDYLNASDFFTNALSRYGDVSDSEGKAVALVELAQLHLLLNKYNQAFSLYSEALQIRTDIGDMPGRAEALWGLAEGHRAQRQYSQAITFYSEALQIRTDIGDRRGRADALLAQDESNMAITFYSEVLQIRTDIGDKQGRANALFGLAEGHRAQRQYSQAVTYYSEALQIRTDIGDKRGRAFALQGLADVHRVQNEHTQAVTFYSESLQICTEIGDQYGRAYALRSLGHIHRLQKEDTQATTLYSEALKIFTEIGDQSGRASSLLDLAGVHRDRGNYPDAIRLYTEAANLLEHLGKSQMAAYVSHQIAEVRGLSNRVQAAW